MMAIPAHREVMNPSITKTNRSRRWPRSLPSRQTLSRCARSTRRQLAELLREARVDGLIVQREIPRTPIRDLMKVTVSLPKSNSMTGEQTRSSSVRSVERYHENANCCCRVRYGVCCTGFRPVLELVGLVGIQKCARRSG